MEFVGREMMVAGPEKKFEVNIKREKPIKNFKVFEYVTVFYFLEECFLYVVVFVLIVGGCVLIGRQTYKCLVVGNSSFVDKEWFDDFFVIRVSLSEMFLGFGDLAES